MEECLTRLFKKQEHSRRPTHSALKTPLSLTSVSFGDVTAGTGCSAQKGQAVYCGVASGKETASLKTIRDSLLHPSPIPPPVFSSTELSLVEFEVGSLVGSILHPFHHKTTQLSLRADVVHDYPLSGNTLLPCLSLKQGYSNIPVMSDSHSLMLDTHLTLNEKLSTKDKTVNVTDSVSNNLELLAYA
ncbi:hypothetical protein BLNAU_23435 [Blattamonas nauphoetae]|uniref:Uncharacterized protein n=1 Tax=Blattamonas nauphoetae TaxID=2049346 RepID=A0ABQ9WQQ4_9EUKA|nr:hypothetical protein BLNAU_23435 [Blattamonas nauphoetae]